MKVRNWQSQSPMHVRLSLSKPPTEHKYASQDLLLTATSYLTTSYLTPYCKSLCQAPGC